MSNAPVIMVTVGDPGGIGPEIIAKLFGEFSPRNSRALIVGSSWAFASFTPWLKAVAKVTAKEVTSGKLPKNAAVSFLDTKCSVDFLLGQDSRGGGTHAGTALELACEIAGAGKAEAIVTAPISKNSLAMAGYHYTGHTEMFADRFDAPDCQMVMTHENFRVVPLTRHIPIADVARAITPQLILSSLAVLDRELKNQFGVAEPHIAVSALNPHAGDGGVIGREEIDVITPTLERARRDGYQVTGPVPADALFQNVEDGTFDAFMTMYHDQGLIPFKMQARRRGINVTLGLPVVRTSVDHGVAYDIAGQYSASSVSLRAAYQLAEELVLRRASSSSAGQVAEHRRGPPWNSAMS